MLAANLEYDRIADAGTDRLAACKKPMIAMINGWRIGGGLGMWYAATSASSDKTPLGIPAARLGLGYDAPGLEKLIDIVGPAFTTGSSSPRHFTAVEAQTMRLVNRVCRRAGNLRAQLYCATIADNAPMTMHALSAPWRSC